jgi:hypothetical protein
MPLVNLDIYRTMCEKAERYDEMMKVMADSDFERLPELLAQMTSFVDAGAKLAEMALEMKVVLERAVAEYDTPNPALAEWMQPMSEPEWLGDARKVLEKMR